MSRIGLKPVPIIAGVKVQVSGVKLSIEGPKGKFSKVIHPNIQVQVAEGQVLVKRTGDDNQTKALHGLTRAMIHNMIVGATNEFVKNLLIEGVGFKAQVNGKVLQMALGFSHPIDYTIPDGIKIETPKPTQLIIKGADKQLVGKVASEIRRLYKPEPYKGKGIRYLEEVVRRKKGKAVEK